MNCFLKRELLETPGRPSPSRIPLPARRGGSQVSGMKRPPKAPKWSGNEVCLKPEARRFSRRLTGLVARVAAGASPRTPRVCRRGPSVSSPPWRPSGELSLPTTTPSGAVRRLTLSGVLIPNPTAAGTSPAAALTRSMKGLNRPLSHWVPVTPSHSHSKHASTRASSSIREVGHPFICGGRCDETHNRETPQEPFGSPPNPSRAVSSAAGRR